MDPDVLRTQLMPTFLEELAVHVVTLRGGPEVFAEPDRIRGEDGQALVRAAHTVKGAASALGFDLVAEAGQRLEQLLSKARAGGGSDNADLVALLPRSADALEDAGGRLSRGESLDGSPLEVLMSELTPR